jgi:hypothetical protein
LEDSRLGDRLELRHLGDHGAGVVGEARVGGPVADHPDHRRHAIESVDRRLGVGDQREAAHLAP